MTAAEAFRFYRPRGARRERRDSGDVAIILLRGLRVF